MTALRGRGCLGARSVYCAMACWHDEGTGI